jgi:hypothetical protein
MSDQPVKSALFHSLNRDWVLGFLLLIATFVAYQPAWSGAPIWDDDAHMIRPDLRPFGGLARIWTQLGATEQYYPLAHSVFWLEYHLWGNSTLGYHLVNILLHFISALLLVFILRRLKIPGAWLAGAIFALHPVMVESVAWITEMKNTLSGVFFLSTILTYLKYDQKKEKRFYILSIGLFILGLMSKTAIAPFPPAMLAVLWWKRGSSNWKREILPILPFFLAAIGFGIVTFYVERRFLGAWGKEFDFTFIERCLVAGRAFWFYLGKLFWPADLVFIYPRWKVDAEVWWHYFFPLRRGRRFGPCAAGRAPHWPYLSTLSPCFFRSLVL